MANYIMPLFAPLAMLIAISLARWIESGHAPKAYRDATRVFSVVMICGSIALAAFLVYFKWLNPIGLISSALTIAASFYCFYSLKKDDRRIVLLTSSACVVLLFVTFTLAILPNVYEYVSYKQLAQTIKQYVKSDDVICYVHRRRSTFSIYAGKTQDYKIMANEPNSLAKINKFLDSGRDLFCLVSGENRLAVLKANSKKPINIIARREEYIVATTADINIPVITFKSFGLKK
jgi:hypothetical protein